MLCQRISDQRIFRDEREIGKLIAMGEEGDGALSEVRNSRAVTITKRVQDKLTGRDFDNDADDNDGDGAFLEKKENRFSSKSEPWPFLNLSCPS